MERPRDPRDKVGERLYHRRVSFNFPGIVKEDFQSDMVRYFSNQGCNQGVKECKLPPILTQSALFCNFLADIEVNVNTYFFQSGKFDLYPFCKCCFLFWKLWLHPPVNLCPNAQSFVNYSSVS